MIVVNGYGKTYQDVTAVSGLSFAVEPGQVLGLVGPNGAGKTTTIRAITGIIPPTEGTLTICGHDIVTDPIKAKQQLAYIPDDPQLFDLLTVYEHLMFTARVYGLTPEELEERADRLLSRFELLDKLDTPASDLSRGMRQKVAISCAYLHEPRAILFDEPLTGLDPQAIRNLKNSIRERATAGASVMISSHLLSLVEDLCTHILILDKGQRRFFGSLQELRTEYSTAESLEEVFFQATGMTEAAVLASSEAEHPTVAKPPPRVPPKQSGDVSGPPS